MKKDLEYYRKNAEKDYSTTPISLLKHIKELEQALHLLDVVGQIEQVKSFLTWLEKEGESHFIDKDALIDDWIKSLQPHV